MGNAQMSGHSAPCITGASLGGIDNLNRRNSDVAVCFAPLG
jgi:hypothetical protein